MQENSYIDKGVIFPNEKKEAQFPARGRLKRLTPGKNMYDRRNKRSGKLFPGI